VGAGAVATALARAAASGGCAIVGFFAPERTTAAAAAAKVNKTARAFPSLGELVSSVDLVVIAVPDRSLADADRAVARFVTSAQTVAHTSGAHGAAALAMCARAGAATAALHPIQTFPDREGDPARVAGAFASVEGSARAVAAVSEFARRAGMLPFELPAANRALYHASAVLASNAVVALYDLAIELFSNATKLDRARAGRALAPLFLATAENLSRLDPPAALSGPVARGDVATVRRHVDALRRGPALARAAYHILCARAVDVALAKGTLTKSAARELKELLLSKSLVSPPPTRAKRRR
jgi:predicted short-subunit dehydrogenase-like oxidoreductase (DUF2520 family)